MFSDIARLLIETAAAILGAALLLRLYMNYAGMPSRNPLAQFVFALTDWLVRPLRRVLPAAGRLDLASLVAVLLLALLALVLSDLVTRGLIFWDRALILTPLTVLRWALNLVFWLTIIHVVLSWVNPHAPIAPAVSMLLRPFLAPFQKILPLVGGLDLSPIALIVVVNILLLIVNRAAF
ncbi:MAG: YggT family protein [Burkholderiaceae bacterium]|nr:YggT family protein [Burkholderiaceae bacterium]